jgi:nicotinamide mononucleotide transporter
VAATELAAVALGFAYILLAIRQHRACWIAGGASTALFIPVFIDAGLPLQAALQGIYVAMSVYGWVAWRPGGDAVVRPRAWPWPRHLLALAAVGGAAAASAPFLASFPGFDAPLADALGAFASLVATWLLARRIIDTWYWWIIIDTGLSLLYLDQGLHFTAALYLAFAVLAIAGWRSWRRAMDPPA